MQPPKLLRQSLLLFLIGCAVHQSKPTPATAARRAVWSIVDSLTVPHTAALARFGPPRSVHADTIRMIQTPERLDSIVRIRFAHFESTYYVHPDRQISLSDITIDEPVASLPAGVRVGDSREQLETLLGAPDADEPDAEGRLLLFTLHPGEDVDDNVINVFVVNGRVHRVSWVFFPEKRWPAP